MKKAMLWSTVLVLLLAVGGAAQAAYMLSDTLTWSDTSSELVATDGWRSTATQFTWGLDWVPDGDKLKFTYTYTLTVPEKNISHFIIEVSPSFTSSDILDGSSLGWLLDDYSAESQGSSNPGMPSGMYGVKWNFGDVLTATRTLVTYRPPEWRDFYAKDGKDDHIDVTLWNAGFGTDHDGPNTYAELMALKAQYDAGTWTPYRNKIIAPDTLGPNGNEFIPIPEPSSVALLILALGAGLYSGGKRLRRKA